MASRGEVETEKLKANVQDQLNRLITQLNDLEEMKNDLDDDEYEMTRTDTLEQLKAFEASLQKMMDGSVTLVDELGSIQLQIQAAIREAFTPEIMKMFQNKEPEALRRALANLEEDLKLGRISKVAFDERAGMIVSTLTKLGVPLSSREQSYQSAANAITSKQMEEVKDGGASNIGSDAESSLLSNVASSIKEASSENDSDK